MQQRDMIVVTKKEMQDDGNGGELVWHKRCEPVIMEMVEIQEENRVTTCLSQ